jgi:hypothetical protein
MTFGVFMNEAIVKKEGTFYGSGESSVPSSRSLPCYPLKEQIYVQDVAARPVVQDLQVDGQESILRVVRSYLHLVRRRVCRAISLLPSLTQVRSGGAYGLVLDSTFSRSSSATSPAYDNEVLCTAEALISDKALPFECLGLEVWATSGP